MLALALNIQAVRAEPRTWTVDDNGPADFSSIQEAINSPDVKDGDTIYVYNGTYYENVIVNKKVSLIGEDRTYTVIYGNGIGTTVYVTANNVNISQFTIQNGTHGIYVTSRNAHVSDNMVTNISSTSWAFGIRLREGLGNNTILRNVITSVQSPPDRRGWGIHAGEGNIIEENLIYDIATDGIAIRAGNNLLIGNNISNTGRWGIQLGDHGGIVRNNVIRRNIISNINVSGAATGIRMWESYATIVEENELQNDDVAISLSNCEDNLIRNNAITNSSEIAILIYYGYNNTISRNAIKWNNIAISPGFLGDEPLPFHDNFIYQNEIIENRIGIQSTGAANNTIFHNNFIHNEIQVYGSGTNIWDGGYPLGGNYWSDYVGEDLNGDGIGDSPYIIDADDQDNYPLMEPWSPPTMIRTLIRAVRFWSVRKGTEISLTYKLEGALHLLDIGKENGAVHKLMAFINQVDGLRGKKLTDEQANQLVGEAQRIIDVIKG